MNVVELGPFDSVLDVGGNVGDFAESCKRLWPSARITSFEPVPGLARANAKRGFGRWAVEPYAISDREGSATLHVCTNQHSASTLQEPGAARRQLFGIRDEHADIEVKLRTLDSFAAAVSYGDRLLIKFDVEGHEREAILGAARMLALAAVVIVEVNQDRDIFRGSPSAADVDLLLRMRGLEFAGVLDALKSPGGSVVQFDGVWRAAL